MLEDSETEEILNGELTMLHFLAVWFLALLPLFVPRRTAYSKLVAKLPVAPSSGLLFLLGLLFYTLSAAASVIVRIDGGRYVTAVNRQSLNEFWFLHVALAVFVHFFFNCERRWLALLVLLASIVAALVVAQLFYRISDVAGLLMIVFSAWLGFLFCLSLAIALRHSDAVVQSATRKVSSATV